MNRRQKLTLAAVATVGAAGIITGLALTQQSSPKLTSPACQSDPAAHIAALPVGATFTGTGCYDTSGITLTKSVHIVGGTYYDTMAPPTANFGSFHPVFRVQSASGVSLTNVTISGSNATGKYHAKLVSNAGVEVENSSNVQITHVSVNNVYGDGLELWTQGPRHHTLDSHVSVDGLTISGAGRNGITPAAATDSTFTDMHVLSQGLAAMDFEADIPGYGAGNLTFTNSSWGGTLFQEKITGPVVFNNDTLSAHVFALAKTPVTFDITFNGGSLTFGPHSNANAVADKGISGLTFNGVAFHRIGAAKGPMWSATNGAGISFVHCGLSLPMGTTDATSTVKVTP